MVLAALFFQLVIGHAVGDYVLQPGPMSSAKNRHSPLRDQYEDNFPQWYYWLAAHSLTHAGIVFVITGSFLFSIIEMITHGLIDFIKCERKINHHLDQCMHIAIKAGYCVMFYFSIG